MAMANREITTSEISTLEWWTCREVANLLRVDGSTVRRWLESGRLKGAKTPGGSWRIHSSIVEEIRRSGIAAPTAPEKSGPEWDASPDHFGADPDPKSKARTRT